MMAAYLSIHRELENCNKCNCETGIEDTFDEVLSFIAQCKFNNCQHDTEIKCGIKAALDSGDLEQRRWESYQKLQDEQKERNIPKYEKGRARK